MASFLGELFYKVSNTSKLKQKDRKRMILKVEVFTFLYVNNCA